MTPSFTEYSGSPQLKDIRLNNLHLLFVYFVNQCSAGIRVYYGVYYPRRYWNKVSFNRRSSFLLHSRKPKCLDKFGLFWKMSLFKIKTAAPTINQLMPPEKMFLNMDHSGLFFFIRTKWSERAKRAHSVLREVEKMGYKKIFARTCIG